MNLKLIQQIHSNMESKSTEELLKIWEGNNKEQYSEEAFEAIKQLLIERGAALPPQKKVVRVGNMEEIKIEGIQKKSFRSAKKWNIILTQNQAEFIGLKKGQHFVIQRGQSESNIKFSSGFSSHYNVVVKDNYKNVKLLLSGKDRILLETCETKGGQTCLLTFVIQKTSNLNNTRK
ncbi:MAG: hypothetical protein COY75_01580 [Nitrospirae bacterium CG_4_10_14_0_8_um_filter_41_23]|nr:hypothetical protein [Nitrospirota bacterium]OIP58960.1 MAG: hypothetical protein AUK38_06865 [Nitrospirae bacterium CG2_30_41_42]PIQ94149.1 MAG: hypothetical protein COV68_06225 [Nitrospirae bacterium CG11_big_fil_rev_8_21_14_0_20_41_14]PIV43159.1 MAG: hypothetical protein COS27_05570 [Nitrospirae bacterium CG02_land_8_20_14_3_00_41_53]PIW87831.1 MAG: hypothetical protein COZ94_03080 [Nitrospirae bacterium CG_4_8_14_3_um_filter_41_47]PIY87685.1 MAG: hypothetical protein COY75_01580 [Nitros